MIVTEYFPSITLKSFLEELNSEFSQRIDLFQKICDCISYLHRQKILHSDLNVENILICPETFEFKLIDFGLALNIKNEDVVLNIDEGNVNYRMKDTTSGDPFEIDNWGLQLIFLSLSFGKVFTSNEVYVKINNYPKFQEILWK